MARLRNAAATRQLHWRVLILKLARCVGCVLTSIKFKIQSCLHKFRCISHANFHANCVLDVMALSSVK